MAVYLHVKYSRCGYFKFATGKATACRKFFTEYRQAAFYVIISAFYPHTLVFKPLYKPDISIVS